MQTFQPHKLMNFWTKKCRKIWNFFHLRSTCQQQTVNTIQHYANRVVMKHASHIKSSFARTKAPKMYRKDLMLDTLMMGEVRNKKRLRNKRSWFLIHFETQKSYQNLAN
jgi:hypothetical protein